MTSIASGEQEIRQWWIDFDGDDVAALLQGREEECRIERRAGMKKLELMRVEDHQRR